MIVKAVICSADEPEWRAVAHPARGGASRAECEKLTIRLSLFSMAGETVPALR